MSPRRSTIGYLGLAAKGVGLVVGAVTVLGARAVRSVLPSNKVPPQQLPEDGPPPRETARAAAAAEQSRPREQPEPARPDVTPGPDALVHSTASPGLRG